MACLCAQISHSIVVLEIKYFNSIPSNQFDVYFDDFKKLSRQTLQTGLQLIYQLLQKRFHFSEKDDQNENQIESESEKKDHESHKPSTTEEDFDVVIVSYLRSMRTWEDHNNQQSKYSLWFEKIPSHLLHSFFMILNSICQLLSSQQQSICESTADPSNVISESFELSQLSQLSRASERSEGKDQLEDESETKGTRGKRKKPTNASTNTRGRSKLKRVNSSEPPVDTTSVPSQQPKQSEAKQEGGGRGAILLQIVNEAMEFKSICRKARIGSLAEVILCLCCVVASLISFISSFHSFLLFDRFQIF